LLLATAAFAVAENAPRPESLIKWRQSAFQVIAWNTARIKGALDGHYDPREVRRAANTLAAVAQSDLPALFTPASATGRGWRDTTARDTAFNDAGKFRAAADEFAREAAQLARLAAGTDQQAVTAQFARVAQTCKSCHQKFRQID
jgi:cytochrome c556